jgi:hypothetical protein
VNQVLAASSSRLASRPAQEHPHRFRPRRPELVSCPRDSRHNSPAGHPTSTPARKRARREPRGWRRSSSFRYAPYPRSSRRAIRAPRSGPCATNHAHRTLARGAADGRLMRRESLPHDGPISPDELRERESSIPNPLTDAASSMDGDRILDPRSCRGHSFAQLIHGRRSRRSSARVDEGGPSRVGQGVQAATGLRRSCLKNRCPQPLDGGSGRRRRRGTGVPERAVRPADSTSRRALDSREAASDTRGGRLAVTTAHAGAPLL